MQGATAHMAPGLLGANVRALAPAILGAKLSPDAESVRVALMDQIRTAVATLESMDEPVEKTVEDTKTFATSAIADIDAAIAAGQQTDPPPEGGGEAAPRANASQIAGLTAAKAQLETDQSAHRVDGPGEHRVARHVHERDGRLAGRARRGRPRDDDDRIEAARRKAIGTARQMEAMGRTKEQNFAVVAGALGTAMGQASVMHALTTVHLEKQKKKLAAMPKPEPPPAQP